MVKIHFKSSSHYFLIQYYYKEVSKMESNKLRKATFKTLLFFAIILLFAALNSCSTTGSMTVAPENRIAVVPDQPKKGTWESKNIVLEYEFAKEEDGTIGLIIDGKTKRRLDQVVFWVLFLDKEGRLLERETVFNSGFRSARIRAPRMQGTIERVFEVPKGTKYLAFQSQENSYRGRKN
jgi:hypothetical protein